MTSHGARWRRAGAGAALLLTLTACATPATDARRAPETVPGSAQPGPAAMGGFAQAAARPVTDVLVPECVPRSGPPYQIGVVGSLTASPLTIIPGVDVTGLTGVFCAVGTLVNAPPDRPEAKVCAELVAPKNGIKLDPVSTKLNIIKGVTSVLGQVTVEPESFTAFICDDDEPGPLALATTIRASAVPQTFGTACLVGPLAAAATGQIVGPLRNATATLTSPPFPVTAVQENPLCPLGLAQNVNQILGLPLAASVTGLSVRSTTTVYRNQ